VLVLTLFDCISLKPGMSSRQDEWVWIKRPAL